MARPWRLRHKLLLGMALVVASVALLLGGALLGITSFMDAMATTDQKLHEVRVIVVLRESIHLMGQYSTADLTPESEKRRIQDHVGGIQKALDYYRQAVTEYADKHGLPPEEVEGESFSITRLQKSLDELTAAVGRTTRRTQVTTQADRRLLDEAALARPYQQLLDDSRHLFDTITDKITRSIEQTKRNNRRGLFVSGSATVFAVLLVLTLLHYFRLWVFAPIRELQAGVQRVHGGDFDHPIRLSSKDELEELADEFNAMTARLRDIYKDLARQVNERSRQLVRSERMVSVGFLAAGVAHEINNPLASIAFCSEALERRLADLLAHGGGEPEVVAKYLKMIQQEAFRCKQITQKLLDFSRTGERAREPTDLGQLVQDVLEVAQHLQNCRGKEIVFRPDTYVVAPVNAPDVKSVVLNLVVNALDSMDEGGTLSVALEVRGEFAEMSFRDTGCGMTADVLENIFEPFFTRNRTGNGTGLGLSISHQIIDQHGGAIAARSDGPGRGSTFVVRVPLAEAATAPEPAVLPFPRQPAAA